MVSLRSEPTDSKSPERNFIIGMVNMLHRILADYRHADGSPQVEALMMTALVTVAGCLHGENRVLCDTEDMDDEMLAKMLVHNFRTGQEQGHAMATEHMVQYAQAQRAASGQGQPS